MDVILVPLIQVIIMALRLYWWAIVIYAVIGWLEQFNIINRHNSFVYSAHTFLFRIVEPALAPIRRVIPDLGGVDLSPLALMLGIWFVEMMLVRLVIRFPF
jgi:YggT family protein